MFITTNYSKEENPNNSFEWNNFFNNDYHFSQDDELPKEIFEKLLSYLEENNFQFGLVFNQVMNELLEGNRLEKPINIIELGSGTGYLTRWLLSNYKGSGVLVDSCEESYKAFKAIENNSVKIDFIKSDIFDLELNKTFDIVCSFGLIEHFSEKSAVLSTHKKYMNFNSVGIIIVPLDTPLSRCFFEIHPEINLGYRELLTEQEFRDILTDNNFYMQNVISSKRYVYDFIAALVSV